MPFSGKSYKNIVEKNKKCKVDFDFDKFKIKVSKETMDLLRRMLAPNPDNRISAKDALQHICFRRYLSSSPLIWRTYFNAKDLLQNEEITKNEKNKKKKNPYMQRMPDRTEDLSPVGGSISGHKNEEKSDYMNYLNFLNGIDY